MIRIPLAFVLVVAACSGKSKQDTSSGGAGGSGTFTAKKVHVSLSIEAQGASGNVFLQTTDETGKQVSHPVGTYPGVCAKTTAAPEMKALTAVACKEGATGTELHAVMQETDVVVLKMRIDDGVAHDPMAREEVTRVTLPVDASVIVD